MTILLYASILPCSCGYLAGRISKKTSKRFTQNTSETEKINDIICPDCNINNPHLPNTVIDANQNFNKIIRKLIQDNRKEFENIVNKHFKEEDRTNKIPLFPQLIKSGSLFNSTIMMTN